MSRIVTVGLTTLPPSMSLLSRQCEILNISQPYRPPRPLTRKALILLRAKIVTVVYFLFYDFSLSALCTYFLTLGYKPEGRGFETR
jgi:hypothetical protein